jgi:predicted glycosyltransferase
MKVMIAVTHLLGTGHLARALTLGRAFAAAGHRAVVASGGMPAPQLDARGVEMLQLPPIRSDGTDFARLLDTDGRQADAHILDSRRSALVAGLTDLAPDVLITELFPFGRRVLAGEFLALLAAAETLPHRPVVLASVRDILASPSKPSRVADTEDMIARHYDAVLVHSDPHITPLQASWPVSAAVAAKLRYTGYVAAPPAGPHPGSTGAGEVLVSTGGGAVGDALFGCAIAAAALRPDLRWRLLVGGNGDRLAGLRARAGGNVVVEAARPDFRQMLHHAAVSVSMCGYNTALDLLQAGTPSVLVPFDDGGEVEQGLRAQSLAALPGFELVRGADLDAGRLCAAVARALQAGHRDTPDLGFDGAARSVAIAAQMAEERP